MNYIILDLEFNQFFGFPHTKMKPDLKCSSEIIQIGMVKLDENLEITEPVEFFVRPQIYPRIHPYVRRITKILANNLRQSPYFSDVFPLFADYTEGKTVFCVWGCDDMRELYKNIMYHGLNANLITKNYINVQKLAAAHLKNPNSAVSLKQAAETFGIETERPFHTALSDAIYTAEILKVLIKEGYDLTQFIQRLDIGALKESITAKVHSINLKPFYEYAESRFGRTLDPTERAALIAVYNSGRVRRFDTNKGKPTTSIEEGEKNAENTI